MFNNWITIGDDKSYSEVRGWFHLKEEDMSHWQALVLDNIRAIKNQKMIEYVEKNPFIIPKSLATRSYSLVEEVQVSKRLVILNSSKLIVIMTCRDVASVSL